MREEVTMQKDKALDLYMRLLKYVQAYPVAIFGSIIGYIIFAVTTPATTWWLGFTVDAISSENYETLRIVSPVLCLLCLLYTSDAADEG